MSLSDISRVIRRKAVWGSKRTFVATLLVVFGLTSNVFAAGPAKGNGKSKPGAPNSNARDYKVDRELTRRSDLKTGTTPVIVELEQGYELPAQFQRYLKRHGRLGIINSRVVNLPNNVIRQLSNQAGVKKLHFDRPATKFNYRTSLTTGTHAVQRALGLTGAGVGIAVIDSGIASWHDDLTNRSTTIYPYGDQRVSAFVDFVNGATLPYDDNGHGTHVSGIIAGNGYDSFGQKAGAAPDASLVSLKVLDAEGLGTISNIIAALDWVVTNRSQYNIRVVNLSVGAGVDESYWTDPLTLAAKRVVDAGVVLVSAAGNRGSDAAGLPLWGTIAAPANAPWVLTVGASSTMGTPLRDDDKMASFSSRGPTYLDWSAKPDLVAPGAGTVSLAAAGSTLYNLKPHALLAGSSPLSSLPYLSLSGTSMAAPVVAGTVALMLQANSALTPNAVKAILQYTAQTHPDYRPLEQGAGFLNAVGAARLARHFATAQPGEPYPDQAMWSKHIIWGSHMLSGGAIAPTANAWDIDTTWGVAQASDGDNIVWGTASTDDNIVWGTTVSDDNIVWGTASSDDNIVWGTHCAGDDCDNIVWGTASDGDNIVWGTAQPDDNIVWGTASDGDNIVWGTLSDDDNIVWGTASDDDNIVWGTATSDGTVVWNTSSSGTVQVLTWSSLFSDLTDEQIFVLLSWLGGTPLAPVTSSPEPTSTTTEVVASPEPTSTPTEAVASPEPTSTTTEAVASTETTSTTTEAVASPETTSTTTEAVASPETTSTTTEAVASPEPTSTTTEVVASPEPTSTTTEVVASPEPTSTTTEVVASPEPISTTSEVVGSTEPTSTTDPTYLDSTTSGGVI